ncbi:phytoene desaturase family protein [Bacillus sp. FJAT-45066]|uniref:phytoene desaturase family protein n=1 Tax=Bacillus sp. FJAT-45066 TaxID=2011010 RepID=UPI000BB77233|nr:phytoene desaturase family protein [Bacillus sp. FJAT-45066]
MTKTVVIVGAGIGGMISALLLRKEGFEVTIYEKESKLGGRLAFVEKDEYKIDKGPTIVLLPEMLVSILKEAGVKESDYELVALDTMYSLHYQDGTTYTKFRSMVKQKEEIEKKFPEDLKGFSKYMNDMEKRFAIGKEAFLEKSFVKKSTFWTAKNIQSLLKLKAYETTRKNANRYFSHKKLQEAYTLQTLYIGGNPYSSPAMYNLIPFSEHAHGIHYIKGGYASLVEVIQKKLLKTGVKIHFNSNVDRIITEDNEAKAIKVNGKVNNFDAVLVNGDFPNMLPLVKQKKKYEPSSSCLLFYFGLNKKYDTSNVHQFFMSNDFSKHMKQVFKEKVIPTAPSFYTFNPSIIDDSLAPSGKSVLYVLVPVPSGDHIDWENEKDFIERMFQQLEQRAFPKLRESVEWMEVRTPKEAMVEGLFQGGSFGIGPSILQSGVFRPQVKPFKFKNVYAAGASIHPGGGIPIVMQGAKLAVEIIKEDLLNQSNSEDVRDNDEFSKSVSAL